MAFKDQLRRARELRGLTQEALAKQTGLKPVQISAFEVGRHKNPSIENIIKLADALELETDFLIERNTQESPESPTVQALIAIVKSIKKEDLDLLLQIASCMAARTN